MKKTTLALAVLAAATLAGGAQAQVCAGFPTVDRGFSLEGRIDFPDDVDSFGVEGSYNAAGPLSVFGGLNVVSGEADEDESVDVFNVGAAFETPQIGALLGPTVSACPQARFEYVDLDGATAFSIPVGIGFGATLATSPSGPTISPYVIPQLVYSKFELDDEIADVSDSSTDFGIRGGALLTFGMFFVGGEVNYVAADNSDAVFGLRAGVRF